MILCGQVFSQRIEEIVNKIAKSDAAVLGNRNLLIHVYYNKSVIEIDYSLLDSPPCKHEMLV